MLLLILTHCCNEKAFYGKQEGPGEKKSTSYNNRGILSL